MLNFRKWFSKEEDKLTITPKAETGEFILKVDNINIGILKHENGKWSFAYTKEFKDRGKEYDHIVGFPDLNKVYYSESLWPFFLICIPGLKQPAVQDIIKKKNINQESEVQLLKQFGYKTIANPYELLPV